MIFCDAYIPTYSNGWEIDRVNLGECSFLGIDRKNFIDRERHVRSIERLYKTEADAQDYIERRDWKADKINPADATAVIIAGMKSRREHIRTA